MERDKLCRARHRISWKFLHPQLGCWHQRLFASVPSPSATSFHPHQTCFFFILHIFPDTCLTEAVPTSAPLSAAGGTAWGHNGGPLAGYQSSLGIDLRLLFLGDVPLSYSFEQSLGSIWATQAQAQAPASAPAGEQAQDTTKMVCTRMCLWTTYPDECCDPTLGWVLSISEIKFDLVSIIDVAVEWKVWSDLVRMEKTPLINTVIVPLGDPKDAFEFHLGMPHNVSNATLEPR